MPNSVTPEEREKIVGMLRDGVSQGKTAREAGRGKTTISRIAKEEGVEAERSATKKATSAKADFDQAARLELLNEGFQKARDILNTVNSPHKLQAWMIGVGIAVDKRRLEDGEATQIGDHTHREAAEKDLSEYFAEIDRARAGDSEADTS